MLNNGRVVQWQDEKGVGFVQDNAGQRTFLHIKAFISIARRPMVGDKVQYRRARDAKGRIIASDVRLVEPHPAASSMQKNQQREGLSAKHPRPFQNPRQSRGVPQGTRMPAFLHQVLGIVSLGMLSLFCVQSLLPLHLLSYVGLLSVLTGLIYWLDKWYAQTNAWRIQEHTLHLFALLGGWPGAWLAQTWVRHKASKLSFQIKFWVTVLLNLIGLMLLNWPQGTAMISKVGGWVHMHLSGW